MSDLVLILTTVPAGDESERVARALVDERLAACVNVLPPMTSIYRWRGEVEHASERQVVIKSTRGRVEAIQRRIAELHSYELPEFIVLPAADGSAGYLEWVRAATEG